MLEHIRFQHPLYARPSRRRARRLRHARSRHRRGAHRARATAPTTSTPACATGSTSTRRSAPADTSSTRSSCSAASGCSTRTRSIEEALKERARLWHRAGLRSTQYPHCWRCHNPVIFLATSQWFIRMDGEPVDRPAADDGKPHAAAGRARRDRSRREVDPRVGPRPPLQHAGEPPRLVHLAPARLGRADSRRSTARQCGEAILTAELVERAASVFDEYGADAWYERPIEEFITAGPDLPVVRRHRRSSASATSSTSGSTRARATRRCCRSATT